MEDCALTRANRLRVLGETLASFALKKSARPEGPHVGEMAGDGGGGGHGGAHQVGAPAAALAAFEIAVGGGRAALAGRHLVRVHRQAHGTAGLAPLEAGGGED